MPNVEVTFYDFPFSKCHLEFIFENYRRQSTPEI
jgi:hypothetical protein